MLIAATSTTLLSPNVGLIAWSLLLALVVLAGAVTAAKGRWGWVVGGLLLTGGLAWLVSAWLAPVDGSGWVRLRDRHLPASVSGRR